MTTKIKSWLLLALLSRCLIVPTASAQSDLLVVTSDFQTGSISFIAADIDIPVEKNLLTIHGDAIARYRDGKVYIVSRLGQDNILILARSDLSQPVIQFSVGNGSNPQDIAFAADDKAYVSRLNSTGLLIVDPTLGTTVGEIDLSSFADGDGLPDLVVGKADGTLRFYANVGTAKSPAFEERAGAGANPADEIIDIGQIEGDTDWLLTDDAVGDATELAIMAADPMIPNFVFSYFVGVDENGHMYGGASPQYAAAIRNIDRNLGEILQAVDAWEALTGEQWTILVVTDHGHQPQQGFGHGFQSPDETSTFVIAENPNLFAAGAINLKYQIVDVTPTVMTLFGGIPSTDSDGVSLTTLGSSDVFPVNDDEALRGALQDAIAMYGYPDIGTNIALGVRTIAATVPYIVYGLTESLTAGLQQIVDQEIFLISPLAALAIVPVRLIGNLTYVVTNVVAQIVARLTGVTGASIFPLWPPAPPSVESPLDTAQLCEGDSEAALPACGQIAV